MKSDGSNVKRITFGKGLYGTPVWSPRGDLIAFTKVRKGRFYIGVMRADGSGERLLTENFYQEAPSWSPNGRVLVFYRETKSGPKGDGFSANLWSIDITGYNERKIKTETDASDPSWSSLLSKWGIYYDILTWIIQDNLKYSINLNPRKINIWNLTKI